MSGQGHPVIQRHCDVLVVGGSAAGLAAALQLGRQRRSVIVVDAGEPRNAPAEQMHGFLGRDGTPPASLISDGCAEVRRYGVEVLSGRVVEVTGAVGRFRAELTGGSTVTARRVLIASGLVDAMPDIAGLAEHWGSGVIHCPFCHGYEVRDRRVVLIASHPAALHPALLYRQLTDHFTIVVHDVEGIDESRLEAFERSGASVVRRRAARVTSGPDGTVEAVVLEDGEAVRADVIAIAPRFAVAADPFLALGVTLSPHPSALGSVVATDESGATSVPGVWAAGNVTDPAQQVLHAAAAGSRAGAMIAFDLAEEELGAARQPSATEVDWDARYGGDQVWSGNPNGSLVAEATGIAPGTALDVGAGEGADAIWLAEHGWSVTAADISDHALDRLRAEATRRGLSVDCRRIDVNDAAAFDAARFDLVSAHYASIHRTADDRGMCQLLDAVAPGGTLLVVGHDPEPMRRPIDTQSTSRPFDPDAYLGVEDVATSIRDDPNWIIDVDEKRPRPPGAASGHHVDDVVLRARRRRT